MNYVVLSVLTYIFCLTNGAVAEDLTYFYQKLTQYERQLVELTGRLEETQHQVKQLSGRLERMHADQSYVSQAQAPSSGSPVQHPQQIGADPRGTIHSDISAQPQGKSPAPSQAPPQRIDYHTSTQLPDGTPVYPADEHHLRDVGSPVAPTHPAQLETRHQQITAGPVSLPTGDAQARYNQARTFLNRGEYVAAEASLRQFVDEFHAHPLAVNGFFWLGETLYVQGKYDDAAVAFGEAYHRHKSVKKGDRQAHSKAPHSLVKLAQTFRGMGKNQEACVTLAQFKKEFPLAPQNVKRLAEDIGKGLKCR